MLQTITGFDGNFMHMHLGFLHLTTTNYILIRSAQISRMVNWRATWSSEPEISGSEENSDDYNFPAWDIISHPKCCEIAAHIFF